MYGDALTTKERIKERLGITVVGFDAFLNNLILAVTARIEQMCGRRFALATYTNELHDGCDVYGGRRNTLILKNAPVQVVSSVQYNGGTDQIPVWFDFYRNDYALDYATGLIRFYVSMPRGYQNIRVTYTGGFSGFSIGLTGLWHFNVTPGGTVDGSNLTFTLPELADQVIVYADGVREQAANITHTNGTNTFTMAAGRAPGSTIATDYVTANAGNPNDIMLPADLVEVAEVAVVRTFKRRESEGRDSETLDKSSIVWSKSIFTDENLATIRNYRRGYNL